MTELREVLGTIEYAQAPLRHRRWMATSYGNDMALGNASLASALWYCVVETLRGNGPCWMTKWPHRPTRLDVIRTTRR
jgi:hypothetical protein